MWQVGWPALLVLIRSTHAGVLDVSRWPGTGEEARARPPCVLVITLMGSIRAAGAQPSPGREGGCRGEVVGAVSTLQSRCRGSSGGLGGALPYPLVWVTGGGSVGDPRETLPSPVPGPSWAMSGFL